MRERNVRPPIIPMTELDARELLAKPLLALCSEHGPSRVGPSIGCDEKTVRNARDEKTTMRLDTALNLLMLDPHAFDGLLGHYGLRAVPVDASCNSDTDRSTESKVLKAALALSIALSDDDEISAEEVRANRDTIEAARNSLDGLLTKLGPRPSEYGARRARECRAARQKFASVDPRLGA